MDSLYLSSTGVWMYGEGFSCKGIVCRKQALPYGKGLCNQRVQGVRKEKTEQVGSVRLSDFFLKTVLNVNAFHHAHILYSSGISSMPSK